MSIDYELLTKVTDKQISLSKVRFKKVFLNKSEKAQNKCATCGKTITKKDKIIGIAVSGDTKEMYHC